MYKSLTGPQSEHLAASNGRGRSYGKHAKLRTLVRYHQVGDQHPCLDLRHVQLRTALVHLRMSPVQTQDLQTLLDQRLRTRRTRRILAKWYRGPSSVWDLPPESLTMNICLFSTVSKVDLGVGNLACAKGSTACMMQGRSCRYKSHGGKTNRPFSTAGAYLTAVVRHRTYTRTRTRTGASHTQRQWFYGAISQSRALSPRHIAK